MLLRILLLVLALGWAPVQAQSPTPAAPTAIENKEDPVEQQKWAQAQLTEARAAEAALDEKTLRAEVAKAGLPDSFATDLLGAVRETTRNYQAAADILGSVVTNQKALDDLKKQPEKAAPKTEAETDAIRDRVAALRQQVLTTKSQVELDNSLLTRSQSTLDAAEQGYRRTAEDTAAVTDPALKQRGRFQLQLAEAQRGAAASGVFLATWRVKLDETDDETNSLILHRLEKTLGASGLDTVFNKKRADASIAKSADLRAGLAKGSDDVRKIADGVNATLAQVDKDAEAAKGNAGQTALVDTRRVAALEASRVATAELQVQDHWSNTLNSVGAAWQAVGEVAENQTTKGLQDARAKAEGLLADLDPWRDQLRRSQSDAQRRLDELTSATPSKDATTRKVEETRLDLQRRLVTQLREITAFIDNQYAVFQQVSLESRERLAARDLSEQLSFLGEKSWNDLKGLWNREIFTVNDKVGVTLGKLLIAILVLVLGWIVSKTVAGTIAKRARQRFGIDPVRAAGFEKLLFAPMIIIIALGTLNWLSIPLTAFAFLGGALAIGVGFGAQTLVNNFISGLILLVERRIKVGDTIEIDAHTGKVLNLGTRCSRISKGNGVEVLVPNSYLLEKTVVNWNLSGTRHQFEFLVSFSYGTDPKSALALLLQAVESEPKVLKEPKAMVFFEEFGLSSLIFKIVYWVNLSDTDNRVIGSNIRVRIDQMSRAAGLTIASPRQDVVLHAPAPLPVHLEK